MEKYSAAKQQLAEEDEGFSKWGPSVSLENGHQKETNHKLGCSTNLVSRL